MAVAQGDEAAFRALYDRTAAIVFDVVHATVDDVATTEHVVELTWLYVWREAPLFAATHATTGRRVTAWILALAFRCMSGRTWRGNPTDGGRPAGAREALAVLTSTQRRAIALAQRAELDRAEIAESLALAADDVSRALRDGLINARDRRTPRAARTGTGTPPEDNRASPDLHRRPPPGDHGQ